MSRFKVNVTEKSKVGLKTDFLVQLAEATIREGMPDLLDDNELIISLVFVDDKEIKELNSRYRGKDEATDVLSFSYLNDENAGDGLEIGEVVISNQTMQRQAEDYGHSLADELAILFTHGLLHILGYDHESDDEKQRMLKLEKKVLGDKSGLISRAGVE